MNSELLKRGLTWVESKYDSRRLSSNLFEIIQQDQIPREIDLRFLSRGISQTLAIEIAVTKPRND